MTMNWSQNKHDCSNQVEPEAERSLRVHSSPVVPRPVFQTDPAEGSLSTAGSHQWKTRFAGWDVMLAALAAMMIFVFLDVASLGILGSTVTVAAIVAAVGLGHYLLWGRAFERRVTGERQRLQDQAGRQSVRESESLDRFVLELTDRERMELLQLLAATEAHEGREDSAAVRRTLLERIRMFGA
jgi:hypothetical protein